MEQNIVYCGLDCGKCPIYIATKNNDEELRKKTAEQFGLGVEKLYCSMCNDEEEELFFWCAECPIRACARDRGFTTCAECLDYPCEKLAKQHEKYPEQKQSLDTIRKSLS
jgi:hypothetical protein